MGYDSQRGVDGEGGTSLIKGILGIQKLRYKGDGGDQALWRRLIAALGSGRFEMRISQRNIKVLAANQADGASFWKDRQLTWKI